MFETSELASFRHYGLLAPGAFVVAGIGEGELLSVTLAPALLLALIVVLRAGPTNPSPGRPVVSRLRGHRGGDGV